MQTTFCLYVLVLFSIGVGVCHGVDGLDISFPSEDVGSPVHNNDNHLSNNKWHQDASYLSPKEQNMHINPAQNVRSVLPTSQPDLRTDRHKSTRPTSQPDTRATYNDSEQTRWWNDPQLTLMNEQVCKITLDLVEGFANQTNNTQITSDKLVELEKAVQEGFGKQTNDTQITSDQLVALVKTVLQGFANQTNDTNNTSDQLAKTHALVDTGFHNLTTAVSKIADHLDKHVQNISQLCVSKNTCDPCICSDNATNNETEKKTPHRCPEAHFQSSLQLMWQVFVFIAGVTYYYVTRSQRSNKMKVDAMKTNLQNVQSLFEHFNGKTNELAVEVQTSKHNEAELKRNAKHLKVYLQSLNKQAFQLKDLDQCIVLQRVAEHREAMTRARLIWSVIKTLDKNEIQSMLLDRGTFQPILHCKMTCSVTGQQCSGRYHACCVTEQETQDSMPVLPPNTCGLPQCIQVNSRETVQQKFADGAGAVSGGREPTEPLLSTPPSLRVPPPSL
jgi:hypothetical protein